MSTNSSKRPKPHTFVQYDFDNYYAKLGVSPLLSTRDIKKAIIHKQNVAKKRRRFQENQKFSEADFEFVDLQKIAEAFASQKQREEYDRLNPHNAILTVQSSGYDDWINNFSSQIDFVSAWVVEKLDQNKFLPTPESLPLWCPKGLDVELLKFLAQFKIQTETDSSESKSLEESMKEISDFSLEGLQVVDLERIAEKESDLNNHCEDKGEQIVSQDQVNTSNKNDKSINELKKGEKKWKVIIE